MGLPLPGVSEIINNSLPQGAEQIAADPLEFPVAAATMIWLLGIGGMLIYSAVSLISLRRKLVGAVRLQDNIYLADHIATPFVLGVFRPGIYLPSTLREEEQSYVVLHEQAHIRRLDHLVKMLAFLALAVHWFNPLVWVAFVFAVKDMEMSCDERVLKQMGSDVKGAYSTSLLSLAAGRRLINGSPLAFGEGNIKGRIKNVLNFKKPAAWVIVISVLLVAVLSIGFAANGTVHAADPDGSNNLDQLRKADAVIAFVDEKLSETEARALQSWIEQTPNVDYADFETREDAMTKFSDKFEDKSLFENIDPGVFRHRYYVYMRDRALIEQTVNDIARIEGIASVKTAELFAVSPSVRFSDSEISSAMECVILKFQDFKGCQLTKLWYDEEKSDDYIFGGYSAISGIGKDSIIVLYSDFTVDSSGGDGSLNPNSTYTDWMWILIRDSKEGAWRVHDWGY